MIDLLPEFERSCEAAGVRPTDALKAANVHPTLWWKWKSGGVSPTLKSFEKACDGLRILRARADAA